MGVEEGRVSRGVLLQEPGVRIDSDVQVGFIFTYFLTFDVPVLC